MMQVCRLLFIAYTTHRPMVAQVAFRREDGLLLSYYYDEGNGTTRLVFSNNTAVPLNAAAASSCYCSQVIDEDTGVPAGTAASGGALCNVSSWPDNAFGGLISLEPGWVGAKEPVLLFTAPVKAVAALGSGASRAALSLDVPVRALLDSIGGGGGGVHGRRLFLTTSDGHIVGDGGPLSSNILFDNGTTSTHMEEATMTSFLKLLSVHPCRAGDASTSVKLLDVGGQKFNLYCAPLDYEGINLVFFLASLNMGLTNHIRKFSTIGYFLLLSILSVMTVSSILILRWIRKYQRREAFLHSSLIKQKEATQQAERKSMNKSLAFASASHDVRTSLAGITGLIELCRAEVSPQSELDKNLDQMNVCASNLLGILNSVLDISKVEAGKMQLEEGEFDIAKVIEESVDIFHIVALKKGLEVIWDPCDNSVLNSSKVKGDSRRLKQVLNNLLSNAVKFTSEGHVLVRAWAKKPEAFTFAHDYACNFSSVPGLLSCFSYMSNDVFGDSSSLYLTDHDPNFIEFIFEVDDTGIGIPKDKRESIFENYVQVKESIHEGQEGTGLGLGIVQSFVRLMGGEINILDKETDEKGTCFRFNIFLKSMETQDERVDMVPQRSNESPTSSASVTISQSGSHKAAQSSIRDMALCKSLKHEAIHAILLIQGEETRRITERWLENLGVRVWVLDQWELLIPTLEKIKQKLSSGHFNIFEKSHSVVPGIHSDQSALPNNSEIEESIGTKDGLDLLLPSMPIHELHKKTCFVNKSLHILVLLDMNFGPFQDAYLAMNNFAKSINYNQYKVIWLANSNSPAIELRSLRNKEVPCDLILCKPLHGSRLHAILKLLQEFGEQVEVSEMNTSNAQKEKDKLDINSNGDKPLHGMKFLIVEDNAVLRRLASATVSRLGATVELSENGKDALDLVQNILHEKLAIDDESSVAQGLSGGPRHLPFDVILMDCEMPIMNGYEAAKQIRAEEKRYGLHIPIIAFTAHTMAEQEIDFAEAGMDIHLMKPLRADMLLDAIYKIKKS